MNSMEEASVSTFADRLAHWRGTYANRRTVEWRMLREAEQIIRWGVQDANTRASAEAARMQGQLEEARAETQRVADEWSKRFDAVREQRDHYRDTLDEKRRITETRSKEGDEVRVQIGRPDWKGWQICDLEEIAYRLRCGGAVDETPVKIDSREASALVPAPDLVKLDSPRHVTPSEKVAAILAPERREPKRWSRGRTWVMASSGGALGALLATILGRLL